MKDSSEKTVAAFQINVLHWILSAPKNCSRDQLKVLKHMHAQLQCNKTSLKFPLRNPVITPAVHHLTERDHTLGVATHCRGSNGSTTTKSRRRGCTALLREKNSQQWGERDDAGVRGRRDLIPSQWWGSSFPSQAQGNRAVPKAMQLCEQVTCRISSYCHSGVSKKKTKN